MIDSYEYVSRESHGWQGFSEFWTDLEQEMNGRLRASLEQQLAILQREHLVANAHERSSTRRDYRNGFYRRKEVITPLGRLTQVRVPRCRHRGFREVIEGYITRGLSQLTPAIVKAFLNGIPVGKLGQITEALVGVSISPSAASEIVKSLNRQFASWQSRPLGDDYRYLLLDGIHLKRRSPCSLFRDCVGSRKKVVLVAYGFKDDGTRELVSFRIVDKESGEHWEAFLRNLYARGLHGKSLRLITTDEHKAIAAAVRSVYGHVPHQLCWFHKAGNVLKRVRKIDAKAVADGLRKIYQAEHRTQAMQRFRSWRRRWMDRYPDAVSRVERVLEQMLNVFAVPKNDRRAVRTTNVIERVFREVRKRTRPIGCFVNDTSISRVIYATFMHYNAQQRKRHKPRKAQPHAA